MWGGGAGEEVGFGEGTKRMILVEMTAVGCCVESGATA